MSRPFATQSAVSVEKADGPAPPQEFSTETAPKSAQPRLRPLIHLLVLGGYLLLTLVMTYPVALDLATKVPGGGDAWQHIWNLWWAKHALIDLHTNPYHTDLIYYPGGANLYFHTLVLSAGILSIPLQLAGVNLIATYNLILLSSFVLAGYSAFLLCHHLTRNVWASFVGGFVFSFSPYHFAHMYGHMNLVSLQWMPFYVLLLLKALGAPGAKKTDITAKRKRRLTARGLWLAAGAGALLALNAYTDWLTAIFLVLLTGLLVGWRLAWPSEREGFRAAGIGWGEGLLRLVVLGGVFLLVTSPIFFPTLNEARQGYAQQPPRETLVYSSDLISAFLPSELHPVWGAAIKRKVETIQPYFPLKSPSERVVFLGFTTMILAAFGTWKLRRSGGCDCGRSSRSRRGS